MKIISELADQIEHELRESEAYIDCALKKKEQYPQLAEAYYKISENKMRDQAALHDQVVALITDYKKANGEPPENMKFLYDYLHNKFIDWTMRIKLKQTNFKGA